MKDARAGADSSNPLPSTEPNWREPWTSDVVAGSYGSHTGLVYERAPREIATLLDFADEWKGRTYLVQGDRRVTFGEFTNAVEVAAERIASTGVMPGDRVLLLAYNSPEYVLTMWALWRCHAVPVMGNRWWASVEVEHAVRLTSPKLIISDDSNLALAQDHDCSILPLGALTSAFSAPPHARSALPETSADCDAPGLMLFTSGSTGPPKAVVLSHRSVISNQQNLLVRSGRLRRSGRDGSQQVSLVCTPLFHIGGVSNLINLFITGGRLVMNEGRFDPEEVLTLIEREGVQSFGGVPTMAIRVLEHSSFATKDLSSLRSLPLGGAPLPPALLERMQAKLPQLKERGLANTWGLTESGGFLTLARNNDLAQRPGTVGYPYPVVELRIAQPNNEGDGEILVRSPTVMLGYYKLDDGTIDSQGWLHTGDIGRLDADGFLYVTGRSKDVIIRGGENVAAAHVEQVLSGHPDVLEVAVVGVNHPDLGQEVGAVLTVRESAAPGKEQFEAFARRSLAHFEVPTRWIIQTDPLPTLAGEKTDKKALLGRF